MLGIAAASARAASDGVGVDIGLYLKKLIVLRTAYGEDLSSRVIASGICRQAKNSVSLIQRIAESEEPMLWIIRWSTQDGRVCTNHVITKNTTYDVAREWIGIIGRECGFLDEILELKAPDANN